MRYGDFLRAAGYTGDARIPKSANDFTVRNSGRVSFHGAEDESDHVLENGDGKDLEGPFVGMKAIVRAGKLSSKSRVVIFSLFEVSSSDTCRV